MSLIEILSATLNSNLEIRRLAEKELLNLQSNSDNFINLIFNLLSTTDSSTSTAIKLSAALNFKNYIKLNWGIEDAPTPLTKQSALSVKAKIIDLMIQLSNSPNLQIQIIESISIIAQADFPESWDTLIDQLVAPLSSTDYLINNAILQTLNSIFKRWRSEFRTDTLFLEIAFVLQRFCEPYLQLFQQTDLLLSSSLPPAQTALLHKTILLLLEIYHSLNSQDLPEFFEDRLSTFMALLIKYLDYSPIGAPALGSGEEDEEEEAGDLENIKSEICEIASLYSLRYLDVFGEGGYLGPFVERTWGLLTKVGLGVKYDVLVAKATAFLSVVVKMPSQRSLFETQSTLEAFCEKIILPNMTLRLFEEEMFEEDCMEYVRRDLESANSETRRQAASDFTKALMEQFETQITSIVTQYIGAYLAQYAADPITNWKSKDTAIFLLTSIASRGSTAQHGVTSTNALVDVIKFFSDNILIDLQATGGSNSVHPIIQADAIKFLFTFRNQLTKDQLLSVIPLLVPHLKNQAFVIHTYAAITIERILFIKLKGSFLFGQSDIRPYAEEILNALFSIIESGDTPQLIAANDHLMKSVMRVIITARQTLTPIYVTVLNHLTKILVEISKNPSNPKFNHYTFESISALIRFVTAGNPSTLSEFESALFPPFHSILQNDVSEFSPFVFQILSQLLELHVPTSFPEAYQILLPPLLTPSLWEQKGNVPALVRLLRAFLSRGSKEIVANGQVPQLLGVFQHLISQRSNDTYGFELLEALVEFIPTDVLKPFMSNPVFVLLLTRLQGSKTDKFTQGLIKFICFACAIEKEGLNPDVVISMLDGCQPQPGLFAQVLPVLLPEVQKAPTKDRKLIAVGLANILSKSQSMLTEPSLAAWVATMEALLKLFLLPLPLTKNTGVEDEIEVPDAEDVGYQASFSKLGASETTKLDLVAHIIEPRIYFAESLVLASQSRPGQLKPLILAAGQEFAGPFLHFLEANRYDLR